MSDAPESTAVTTPPHAPPAPAPATVEHISALHRHLNELCAFVGKGFKELAALVEKAGPVVETAAAAVAGAVPSLAPVAAVGEKVLGVVEEVVAGLCNHPSAHAAGCTCAKPPA